MIKRLNFLLLFLFLAVVCFAQNTGIYPLATASGTDTYTATVIPSFSAYATGQRFNIKFTNANTGAATININSKGAKSIVKTGTTALSSGDISAGQILFLQYDGTNMQIVGGGGSGGGGGVAGLTADFVPYATSATAIANSTVKYATSLTYSSGKSLQVMPILTGGNSQANLEILNLGNQTSSSENRNLVPAGIARGTGSIIAFRNMQWDNVNLRWTTPYQQADAYGSACYEAGGEASILHATPAGVDFYSVPHEIFLASAHGTDGPSSSEKQTTGYYNQIKAPLWGRYSSAAYDPVTTNNTWNPSTADDPIAWFSAGEAKGTDNEFIRLETNMSAAAAWPAMYLAKSTGSHGTKTIVVTNQTLGRYGFKAYDGVDYEITAAIEGSSRGTIANNNVGQALVFKTSPDVTSNLTSRFEITDDGVVKATDTPYRMQYATVTGVPTYSSVFTGSAGQAPVINENTCFTIAPLSSTNGGFLAYGLSNTTASANAMFIGGVQGSASPTAANTVFRAVKNSGGTTFQALAATEIGWQFQNSSTVVVEINGTGKITNNPTNTSAGTTGAQTINKPSGTVNFAAGASSLVVTNSLVTTSSLVFAVVRTNDATAVIKNVVPAAGSFTIRLEANATAETSVGFFVMN